MKTAGKHIKFSIILLLLGVIISCSENITNKETNDITHLFKAEINNKDYFKKKLVLRKKNVPARKYHIVKYNAVVNLKKNEKYYGIALRRVAFLEKVIINNEEIGSRLSNEISYLFMPRYYKIKRGALHKGINNITIEIGLLGEEYGGISDSIKLLNKKNFYKQSSLDRLIFNMIPFGIVFLFISFSIISTIMYIINRDQKIFGPLALMCLIPGITILALISPFKLFHQGYYISLLHAAIPLSAVVYMKFIQKIYSVDMPEHNKFFMPVLFYSTFIIIFSKEFIINSFVDRTLGIIAIAGGFIYLLFMLRRLNSIRQDSLKLIVSIIFLFSAAVTFSLENIASVTATSTRGFIYIFTSPLIITIAGLFIIIRYSIIQKHGTQLYNKLQTGDNNHHNNENNNHISVNNETAEKLNKIKSFIENNYNSDLSREGLGAAVGMNPNYMSRLYKIHTGIKINDYINQLRIEDAEKRLIEGNERIIDIALSVGFESLTTFNRAFRHINNMTPTEYRNTNSSPKPQ